MTTKQERIDAAVAVVVERAQRAFDGEVRGSVPEHGYVEPYMVAATLAEQGVISHPDLDSRSPALRDAARRSIDGKARRLLDEAAAGGRIVRLRASEHPQLPQLDGTTRPPYASATNYTTPELYKAASAAVETAQLLRLDRESELRDLVERALALGFPEPTGPERGAVTVTYNLDAFRAIVERVEAAR
jgi:hypothetical protein